MPYICFTIHFDMFQIELVSINLPWIEIFIKIWFLWNHTIASSYPKKRFQIKFRKTVKITPLRCSHFYQCPNFFHPPQFMVVFTVLGNFLVLTDLYYKIFFLVIAESFAMSQNSLKINYHKKKKYHRHSVFSPIRHNVAIMIRFKQPVIYGWASKAN